MRFAAPSLGSVNLALLSIYFIPVWGREALRTLVSPYSGFEDRAQVLGAMFFRHLFDLNHSGLVVVSHVLAGIKLVIAAAFMSYLIEFARAWVTRREADRETVDVVVLLAIAAIALYMVPAMAFGDAALLRLYSTQMLLVAGAITVIVVERHLASDAADALAAGSPASAAAALAQIPETRLRAH